jgi:hypothetical protein
MVRLGSSGPELSAEQPRDVLEIGSAASTEGFATTATPANAFETGHHQWYRADRLAPSEDCCKYEWHKCEQELRQEPMVKTPQGFLPQAPCTLLKLPHGSDFHL